MKNKYGNKYSITKVKVPTSLIIKLFAVQKQVRVSMKREDFWSNHLRRNPDTWKLVLIIEAFKLSPVNVWQTKAADRTHRLAIYYWCPISDKCRPIEGQNKREETREKTFGKATSVNKIWTCRKCSLLTKTDDRILLYQLKWKLQLITQLMLRITE